MIKYAKIKPIIDKIIAIILIIISIPIWIIIGILIKLDSKGKVLFKHKRLGKKGKVIYVYKFRTMKNNAEQLKQEFNDKQLKEFEENFKLKNDPRITKIGRKLRVLSLDEIPQLINVIKGDLWIRRISIISKLSFLNITRKIKNLKCFSIQSSVIISITIKSYRMNYIQI